MVRKAAAFKASGGFFLLLKLGYEEGFLFREIA